MNPEDRSGFPNPDGNLPPGFFLSPPADFRRAGNRGTMNSFIDEMTISVASGHGGAGAVSFRREKYVPKGGPDGGDGGRGGDVIFRVQSNLKTLTHLRHNKTYRAQNGLPGEGRKRHGRDGNDMIITVPPGTRVKDWESGEVLIDLIDENQELVFLTGGIGGQGNSHFATSRNQTPRFAQPGMPGEERKLRLELSLIADIGFVGYPNAGKSSLLGVLTSANPKVGAYPFTTKIPNLGVLRAYDRDIILADIPGIIEGASEGAGLGHRFLKHISRTAALLFLIDLSDYQDPVGIFENLKAELKAFEPGLLDRPHYLLATKMDIPEARERLEEFRKAVREPVFPVSSVTREGVDELIRRLFAMVSPGEKRDEQTEVPDYYSYEAPEDDNSGEDGDA
jgi:GTP-binding protein